MFFTVSCLNINFYFVGDSTDLVDNVAKYHQEITIPIFGLVLKNFAIPGCFPYILFYCYIFPHFLLVSLLLQSVALFQSRELVKYL